MTARSHGVAEADLQAFVERVRGGDVRAGARLMRLVDDRHPVAFDALRRLYAHTGRARILGITGNPGSGKSTLTDQLIRHYRDAGQKVGVVAVDPSSPFSGGAILGDRIRMGAHSGDAGVFIRSLATRGHLGGLSRSTNDVVAVMDAMGFDVVIIETVGVGQDEVEVVRLAHTSVVVLVPGMGDDIQAIKAGILEIADVFCVNKADHPGVDRTVKDIRHLQALSSQETPWTPPIVRTVAPRGDGIAALVEAIAAHEAFLPSSDEALRRRRARESHVLESLVRDRLALALAQTIDDLPGGRDALLDRLADRETDPYTEADRILEVMLGQEA